jgi:TolB protein
MFTPDGMRIVFQSPRDSAEGSEVDLYSMNADGTQQRRIRALPGFDGVPVPSPDGTKIAWQRGTRTDAGFHWELYIDDHAITANAWSSQVPSWSPDGKRLVFYANPQGRDQLFLLDLASGRTMMLAESSGEDQAPSFSHDGRFVAFTSTRDGSRDLYVIDVTGGAVRRLTSGMDVWSQPSWSPDDTRLLFSGKDRGVDEVFVIDADGKGLKRITKGSEGFR